ncbi:MAG: methylated-DNA--[protein]-cysteine S-methyltransferase [Planctomycetes bacterium]|nr:methylated-DNA--[protein]-cysteine S-methyltransferase [Planctomycetota bacterium]
MGRTARRSTGPKSVQTVKRAVVVEHALFPSAIGEIGVAWSAGGLAALQLPDIDARATERRLVAQAKSRRSESPPAGVRRTMERVAALLNGASDDLADVPLDLSGVPPFHARVFTALRAVGPGHTVSYGELARRVGSPGAARAVGQAMRRNPLPIVVPCHRVLAAGGAQGGFSAPGGLATKERLLHAEGVALRESATAR